MTTMQIAIGGGLMASGGLVLLVRELRPAPPDLRAVLARLDAVPVVLDGSPAAANPSTRVGSWLADRLNRPGGFAQAPRHDLALMHRTAENLYAQKALYAGLGLFFGLLITPVALLMGLSVAVPAGLILLGAAAGFILPDLSLRTEAKVARKHFRQGLSAYLDLVSLTRASGAGMNDAIEHPAQIPQGWVFRRIAAALDRGRLAGMTPWSALAELGDTIAVPELRDLAQLADLASADQARVAEALAAKAASMRDAVLTEAKADANARTEQLSVPLALLGLGFLILFGFPAAIRIMGS